MKFRKYLQNWRQTWISDKQNCSAPTPPFYGASLTPTTIFFPFQNPRPATFQNLIFFIPSENVAQIRRKLFEYHSLQTNRQTAVKHDLFFDKGIITENSEKQTALRDATISLNKRS